MRWGWSTAACCLVLLAAEGRAGSPEAPEVSDPAGDVTAFGAPVPAGLGWADVQAAWFKRDGEDLRLSIRVGDGSSAPPIGEVGVTFTVGDAHYIAGYTAYPPFYSGGFVSESDEAGDVGGDQEPQGMPGTFEGGLVTVTFPVAAIDDGGNATGLSAPWGWSESQASNGETYRLDGTEVGLAFAWAAPRQDDKVAPSGEEPKPTPGVGMAALPMALAGWAAARRRHATPASKDPAQFGAAI